MEILNKNCMEPLNEKLHGKFKQNSTIKTAFNRTYSSLGDLRIIYGSMWIHMLFFFKNNEEDC
ncbi:hypothetical protein KEJ27_09355 [Candidatus Bathyarchaeota archaeon]|nr:hypothetical protein [Candidatus Bathyarchaeota archaeon]